MLRGVALHHICVVFVFVSYSIMGCASWKKVCVCVCVSMCVVGQMEDATNHVKGFF